MKTFSNEDLGLDTATKSTCLACRKSSDGAKQTLDRTTVLCGAHYDEYLRQTARMIRDNFKPLSGAEFARELREGPFKPCWEAQLPEGEPT